jgi:hypothetical protein
MAIVTAAARRRDVLAMMLTGLVALVAVDITHRGYPHRRGAPVSDPANCDERQVRADQRGWIVDGEHDARWPAESRLANLWRDARNNRLSLDVPVEQVRLCCGPGLRALNR